MTTQALLDFVLKLDGLKAVERRTIPSGLDRRENSAEHSWHGALCALLLEGECAFAVDARHAALLMLMHDVPEIECGDTFAYADGSDTAHEREAAALSLLLATLPSQNAESLRALWEEFNANVTPEARYANALDRVMPVLHNLANHGHTWREGRVSFAQVLVRTKPVAEVLPQVWAHILPQIQSFFPGAHDDA